MSYAKFGCVPSYFEKFKNETLIAQNIHLKEQGLPRRMISDLL